MRDLRLQAWCKSNGIAYEELSQTGVIRRLRTRDGWSEKWFSRMKAPRIQASSSALAILNDDQDWLKRLSGFGKIPQLA